MKVSAIAMNTFRESIRNKILYSVVAFAFIMVAVSAFFGKVTIGSQEKVIKDFGLFCLSFFGMLITVISGVKLLHKELKEKTIYNILSKPVDRWQFILGKHIGLTLTVGAVIAIMSVSLVLFVAIFEKKLDLLIFQATYYVMLEMIVLAAVCMFFSSLVVTTTLTGLFTLATYFVGRSITYLIAFVNSGDLTDESLRSIVKALYVVVPDLSLFNINESVVYGISASPIHALTATTYCISYSAVCICLGAIIFSRRELN